ncbi:MAG: peptidoglycan editing factor PgeF [Zetaproteobacteria bacterium]|nr:MAG: peptidoglycan editing factor PgeF [Zetaproteobacteria bacterium]
MVGSRILARIGIQAAFTDAADGGVRDAADPLAERIAWRAGFHLPLHQCRQLHGDAVWWVEWGDAGDGADILISRKRHHTLAIRTADCLPVLLADGEAGVVAAVHAGWRGTVCNVVARAVAVMVEIGARAERIHADFGPAIGPCCFRVEGEARARLQAAADGVGVTAADGAAAYADLAAINRWQLERAGVPAGQIDSDGPCTCCSGGYFSHRRDRSPWRQLSLISA